MTLFAARCAVLLLLLVPCVLAARWMAARRGRSPNSWMLAAALLGPFPLLILVLFAFKGTMKVPSALFALVLLSAPTPCLAWGAEGHRIVAAIAADELSPAARAEVARLLGTDDAAAGMVAVSTWADEIRRQRPNTAPWHFVDIPVQATAYDRGRDCQGDDCVVAQIERDARIVGDRQLAPPVRAEALRFLIHFVGGVHQPLHDADNGDRGGNNIRVIIGKRHSNMHAVWDVDVVRALGRNPDEVAARLEHEITPTEKQQWSGGPPPDWANEGHRLARDEIYARISGQGGSDGALILTQAYARQESSAAATQLEKAGVRLGAVLNQALR